MKLLKQRYRSNSTEVVLQENRTTNYLIIFIYYSTNKVMSLNSIRLFSPLIISNFVKFYIILSNLILFNLSFSYFSLIYLFLIQLIIYLSSHIFLSNYLFYMFCLSYVIYFPYMIRFFLRDLSFL